MLDQHSVPTNMNGLKVLCIEDEFFISELYDRALRRAGYDVTNALNGDDGLALAQTDKYDIILLDLMVPGKTGMEILRSLRDPKQTPHLKSKIIITTNLVQDDDAREQIEAQADGYIIKADITPKELVTFLTKLDFTKDEASVV
jgi:DNA-binding response OmpR family regulator